MGYPERSKQILELVKKCGSVQVAQLSQMLGVSVVTIRKDLQRMERECLLCRTHGGAAIHGEGDGTANQNASIHRIAEQAAAQICDGDCVIMNAGDTTLMIASKLQKRKDITLITNSIAIARELVHQPDLKLIFLGGEVNMEAVFTYGWDAVSQLEQYKANKVILSASGLSCRAGLTTKHMEAADLMRKMIERAQTVIIVADDTKIGFESFYHIGDLRMVDMLITHATPETEQELQKIEAMGIDVCRC